MRKTDLYGRVRNRLHYGIWSDASGEKGGTETEKIVLWGLDPDEDYAWIWIWNSAWANAQALFWWLLLRWNTSKTRLPMDVELLSNSFPSVYKLPNMRLASFPLTKWKGMVVWIGAPYRLRAVRPSTRLSVCSFVVFLVNLSSYVDNIKMINISAVR